MNNPCINCITLPVCKQIAKIKHDDIENAHTPHLSGAGKLRVLTYSMSTRCGLLFDYAVKLTNLRTDSEGAKCGTPSVIDERAQEIFIYMGIIK